MLLATHSYRRQLGASERFSFRLRHIAKTRWHRAAAAIAVVRITAVAGGDALGSLEQRRGVAAVEATAGPALFVPLANSSIALVSRGW
jgi:hypothetical protein